MARLAWALEDAAVVVGGGGGGGGGAHKPSDVQTMSAGVYGFRHI